MAAKRAVVTDALSSDFFFPIWWKYYGGLFGPENLFVITYPGCRDQFKDVPLGGLIQLPEGYNDARRAAFISSFSSSLLTHYEAVIRVDVDEIAVPDLRRFSNLEQFLDSCKLPYLTGRGFDLIQKDGEQQIKPKEGILVSQRNYAYPNSSLNKTFYTTLPVTWARGFHASTVYPVFDEVFILHLKRIDVNQQLEWVTLMSDSVTDDADIKRYYSPDHEKIIEYHRQVSNRPCVEGWDGLYRGAHNNKFLEGLKHSKNDRCYHPQHFHEDILVKLPEEFLGVF